MLPKRWGLKGVLERKKIGLERAFEGEEDRVCKEKDDLYERLFKVIWLYQATCLLIEFKAF
jgi:hypothetical protein